ncbi:hypothetical protein GCM10023336_78310 [Streptomyces similanensis]|uniref:Uncharacterized protein n=1 Tax=Streptomyces similanensis TaxID=1274988 RepID=A0ABP9LTA3_9ACTN
MPTHSLRDEGSGWAHVWGQDAQAGAGVRDSACHTLVYRWFYTLGERRELSADELRSFPGVLFRANLARSGDRCQTRRISCEVHGHAQAQASLSP